jgi:hypothetical protein
MRENRGLIEARKRDPARTKWRPNSGGARPSLTPGLVRPSLQDITKSLSTELQGQKAYEDVKSGKLQGGALSSDSSSSSSESSDDEKPISENQQKQAS